MEVSFIGWRKPAYPQKTIDLPELTDKLYHIMLYLVQLAMSWIRTHNVCGDCICSCKSNYYAITATTSPLVNWNPVKLSFLFQLRRNPSFYDMSYISLSPQIINMPSFISLFCYSYLLCSVYSVVFCGGK